MVWPSKLPSAHRHPITTCLHVHVAVVACTHGIFQFHSPLGHGHGMNTWMDVDVPVEVCTHSRFQFYSVLVTLHWWVGPTRWHSNFKGVLMGIAIGTSACYDNLPGGRCAGGRMYTWYISIPLTIASWPWYEQLRGCRCAGAGMYTW